jgi:hypothetical protein
MAKAEFIDAHQVAKLLGININNVRQITYRGTLVKEFTSNKMAYYDKALVEEYLLVRRRTPQVAADLARRRKARQFPR